MQTTLPAEPVSASAARRFVDQALTRLGGAAHAEVAALLVSELVTNVVLHAAGPVDVTVSSEGECFRVEVSDHSATVPIIRPARRDATTGRGLLLVDTLADSWGVERRREGKAVWFTVGSAR